MAYTVNWSVTVDTVTDALVRSHLAKQVADLSLDAFIVTAVQRELDRVALLEGERVKIRPRQDEDMWEIVIPLPPRR